MILNSLLERNLIPDFLIRWKIQQMLNQRLREENKGSAEANKKHLFALIDELKNSPVAVETKSANEQHYEVPAEFYKLVLGMHMKYSCCFYPEGVTHLNIAERFALELTCKRAELKDNMEILELGCGWGSLSLFMADKFPGSRITAVSNSISQKKYIDNEAWELNINNLTVITADINSFSTGKQFDRVVSVEMFEHMRNYRELMKRIAGWLKADGKLFVHIFTHKEFAYKFEVHPVKSSEQFHRVKDESDWMSKYFFTGGIMPSNDLLFYFDEHLIKENFWIVNGMHYSKTVKAWLKNMDAHKKEIISVFGNTYGEEISLKWYAYWRIFFMSCAELWGFNNGNEWMVCHYLFRKK